MTTVELARWVARLLGGEYDGDHDPTRHCLPYFVPCETLTAREAAALGIVGEEDFLGGAVEAPILATKAITHTLWGSDSVAPIGWTQGFVERVREAVLPGFTTFDPASAFDAGRELLQRGAVRLKPVNATGSRGQLVVSNLGELEQTLSGLVPKVSTADGLVLERNLLAPRTYGVGRLRLAGGTVSYVGTQSSTTNGSGETAYGGSILKCVRGDMDKLGVLLLTEEERLAVHQAILYDRAAEDCLPQFMASRRNYDVAAGLDDLEMAHCGVLEQSWRIGGATGAELAAVETFQRSPDARLVIASTTERYGSFELPSECWPLYRGTDPKHGPMLKYAMVHGHE